MSHTASAWSQPRQARPPAARTPTVECPICLDRIVVNVDEIYEYEAGGYRRITLPPATDPRKRADILRTSYCVCPNPSRDAEKHYLPVALADYRPPVVVGLVGASKVGKTHLLAAMIGEIERGGLQPYGLIADPVDFVRHAEFLRRMTFPMLERGERLEGTPEGVNDIADALVIRSSTGPDDAPRWPVTFFDIAGEDLTQIGRTGRFLVGAKALMFVVDPGQALGWAGNEDRRASQLGERTFSTVLARLDHGRPFLDTPAVVVVNKSDRLRFRSPVDRWMRTPGDGRIDPERIRAESRDAFALLHEHDALSWLQPFYRCRRCTLHFASATGGEANGERYPLGARPTRVLEPLLALFAMTGILSGPGAGEVGT